MKKSQEIDWIGCNAVELTQRQWMSEGMNLLHLQPVLWIINLDRKLLSSAKQTGFTSIAKFIGKKQFSPLFYWYIY